MQEDWIETYDKGVVRMEGQRAKFVAEKIMMSRSGLSSH